ncbi:Hypothetical protein R9X50_00749200 [Acrodontium crateriforme]|uniref:Uncharacterized protein n=1 Tax=Acrodontium crateriforme TaxID=150365 RepID=A0AAQ3MB80_9PEZI|nr:Hypothetical protein R9X50_00749200 [Acrodontium crateriforme]
MANTEKQPLLFRQPGDVESHEPSLSELQREVHKAQRRYIKAWSRTTGGKWHQRVMWIVTGIMVVSMLFGLTLIFNEAESEEEKPNTRVPLEAHIMSKCPDARDCLHDLILPTMITVSNKVDFRLSYIGKLTDHDDGVECMHGSEECLGNLIEICAAHAYPDPKIYLGFTMCLSKAYEDIPRRSLVEDCALEHGMSLERLNHCTMQDDGTMSSDLLKESFNRSSNAGVTKSCTVRLNGKIRCIRDGGEWSDCEGGSSPEDLIWDIRELTSLA